jgi:hypothetical protein
MKKLMLILALTTQLPLLQAAQETKETTHSAEPNKLFQMSAWAAVWGVMLYNLKTFHERSSEEIVPEKSWWQQLPLLNK